ncbi:FHA domain-containing protein [Cellulomonas aerilata]|uniref:FHA domain-containing protein n=1 Tax=Cellulomonas aerilata TaxID=515326 RepID=A0A512D8W1_9CELL|nr:FHA domain-containing protein [Cellulomonas aerilata]GEO32837.1 hypothetical protein CAE01nite_05620 [Cellulomonas aerilata]
MIVPEYTPGDWVAVVTDGGVAVLPPGTDGATVRRLWTSMRGDGPGTALVRHLQEITRDGLTSLPPFALLSVAAGRLHAVVRGDVRVAVTVADGSRVLTAPDVATWCEQVVEDVLAVAVHAPGADAVAAAPSFPLLSGVAHVAAVRVELRRTPAGVGEDEPGVEPVVVEPVVIEPVVEPVVAAPVAAPAPHGRRPQGGLVLAPAVPALRPQVPSPAVPADLPLEAEPFDHTLLRPPHAAESVSRAVPPEVVAAVPPVASAVARGGPALPAPVDRALADASADHDGTTVLSADVVALRRRLPDWAGHSVLAARTAAAASAAPAPALAPAQAPAPVRSPARLAMSTGDHVPLNRPVLIGRAPQAARVHSTQVPRLVTVPSPLQDISRTHAEVRMDGDDVVLTDLHSTNGVLVVRSDAGPQRLQPGEATVLQPGVLVDLGEGITFTVERGA